MTTPVGSILDGIGHTLIVDSGLRYLSTDVYAGKPGA